MAVEAPHMNLFPSSQLISNRDLLRPNQGNAANLYASSAHQMDYLLPVNETMPESLYPFYQSSFVSDPILAKASMNTADSGLTYNVSAAPRKRARDPISEFDAFNAAQKRKISGLSSFVNDDMMFQIQQQQSEIDRFIAEHSQKVRMELEERRRRESRMLVSAIQELVIKRLKEKDEEMQRMGKLNWVLQERVNSLFVENQLLRDLAQSNEAAANSLRSNLEQVLAHVSEENRGATAAADEAESSCGSSDHGRCRLAGEEEEEVVKDKRMCKKCGERESSVLLLPCRHLCLCTLCGSTLLGTCPVCDSVMNGSVHVNMS